MDASQPELKVSSNLAKTLGHRNFHPEKFAKSISAQSDGDKDLQENKQRVQALGEETAQILKKQVYKYYQQFIETAKEISYVEGEMFQLNHILTEQKHVMESMANIFLVKEKHDVGEDSKKRQEDAKKDEQRRVLKSLLGKVDGWENVPDNPSRFLVHDGDLSELDMDTFQQIRGVHLFLFNDSLMVTTAEVRRGQSAPRKFKFECLFDVEGFAVINARDVGPVKNAFKLLMFPESKMFQCENSKEKREWLDIMEDTKKKHLEKDQKVAEPTPPTSPVSSNPFEVDDEVAKQNEEANAGDMMLESWVQEMPEDLDVYIAQRYFEQAVELVIKTRKFLSTFPDGAAKTDLQHVLESRSAQLVSVLTKELQSSPDRSHRGGPRAARRPVMLLIKLGESTKACNLYLQNRSSAVAYATQQLRTEGSLPLYMNKLCTVFFNNIKETLSEFESAFKEHVGCYSTFVVWCHKEIKNFVAMIAQQVFTRNADIAEIAECVRIVHDHGGDTQTLGIEVRFDIDLLLIDDITSAIKDHKQKIIDATKLRSSEELWRSTNCGTPKALQRLQDEMIGYGIVNVAQYSYDECFSYLTPSTLAFTRALVTHVRSVVKMFLPELEKVIIDCVEEIERCYTDFVSGCLCSEKERPEKARLIKRNAMFIAESLLPVVETKLQKCIMHIPKQLVDLRKDFIKQTSS